ncbi:hypothetical protein Y032_0031g2397 [Ancylostoma ceylanicum]|uniref:Uncharacterized protein n=1 Tax=Ancylostoma ceylanicum TaxID=53326 RepID=A0A016UPI2_9BILA|nr:hypothetical protein Y032_0031g2397 [Ancylostoma ceylanicum]
MNNYSELQRQGARPRRGHSVCLLQRSSGPAGQRHGGKPIRRAFPLLREGQQITRVLEPQPRFLSTAAWSSLYFSQKRLCRSITLI